MLALINNELDSNIKLAVFTHKLGYQVQLIEGIELLLDEVLSDIDKVKTLAVAYGFDVMRITLQNSELTGQAFLENQSIIF